MSDKLKDFTDIEILEIVEKEMIGLWATAEEIPHLLKKDPEFVRVICEGIYLEKPFWKRHMIVGEA
jgi:hypothetical protein|tara:strand:+ start:754 stop:951 length:198 start_codon:yes stop_codon:yes gene_type:complete